MNGYDFLRDPLMRFVYLSMAELHDSVAQYDSDHDYVTISAALNKSVYSRVLPAVPENCPTPLGVVGKKELPPIDTLAK